MPIVLQYADGCQVVHISIVCIHMYSLYICIVCGSYGISSGHVRMHVCMLVRIICLVSELAVWAIINCACYCDIINCVCYQFINCACYQLCVLKQFAFMLSSNPSNERPSFFLSLEKAPIFFLNQREIQNSRNLKKEKNLVARSRGLSST